MARSVDVMKQRLWQQRLRRFERSDLSVSAFCQAERVSLPSFYHWRKKLSAPHDSWSPPGDKPTRFAGGPAGGQQAFVPIEIVQASTLEIHLPNCARLMVPADDRAALEAAVAAVGRLPRAADAEAGSC